MKLNMYALYRYGICYDRSTSLHIFILFSLFLGTVIILKMWYTKRVGLFSPILFLFLLFFNITFLLCLTIVRVIGNFERYLFRIVEILTQLFIVHAWVFFILFLGTVIILKIRYTKRVDHFTIIFLFLYSFLQYFSILLNIWSSGR